MNLFCVLFWLVVIGAGVLVSFLTGNLHPLPAFAVGAGGAFLVLKTMRLVMLLCDKVFPPRPRCGRGKCSSEEYEYIGKEGERRLFRCKCGTEYVLVRSRFLIGEGGVYKPYMKRSSFGLWRPDGESRTPSDDVVG